MYFYGLQLCHKIVFINFLYYDKEVYVTVKKVYDITVLFTAYKSVERDYRLIVK